MKVIHFNNGTGGGVLSVIRNLIYFQQNKAIDQEVIYTLEKDKNSEFDFLPSEGLIKEQYFYYSKIWNLNFICKKLSKLIPNESAILIAHDWLELAMISRLALKNPVVLVIHGDYEYYYQLALNNQLNVNIFVCIAEGISTKLKEILPKRIADIHYLRFPVKNPIVKTNFNGVKRIIFVGRCEANKGFHLLPIINDHLKLMGIYINWTIYGELIENNAFTNAEGVNYMGKIDNDELLLLLHGYDLILLPSLKEGMPVSVIEAMKAGVIPLVNDISGGIQELVINGLTGFKIEANNSLDYALAIQKLANDDLYSKQISNNCINHAMELFEPVSRVLLFESIYAIAINQNRKRIRIINYGSRLDKVWIPNIIVIFLRKLKIKHLYNN